MGENFRVIFLAAFCRLLQELSKMVLIMLKAFVLLEILARLFLVQIFWSQITADISKIRKSADHKSTLIFHVVSESAISFAQRSFVKLKKKGNCFKQTPLIRKRGKVNTWIHVETF